MHIPYKGGAGAAATALLTGEVGVVFVSVASVKPHVRNNKMKILGVSAIRRIKALADVPTMPELGYKDMKSGSWQGVYVPARTPRAVNDRLFAASVKAMADGDVIKRVNDSGAEVIVSASPEEFTAFMKDQNEFRAGSQTNPAAATGVREFQRHVHRSDKSTGYRRVQSRRQYVRSLTPHCPLRMARSAGEGGRG